MNLEEFRMIICDTFRMDLHQPIFCLKWEKEAREVSYQNWAFDELDAYLKARAPHHVRKPVDYYISLVEDFKGKMEGYAYRVSKKLSPFSVAVNVAESVLDLLNTMC